MMVRGRFSSVTHRAHGTWDPGTPVAGRKGASSPRALFRRRRLVHGEGPLAFRTAYGPDGAGGATASRRNSLARTSPAHEPAPAAQSSCLAGAAGSNIGRGHCSRGGGASGPGSPFGPYTSAGTA